MSSAEIRNKIEELKQALADFENQIQKSLFKYNSVISKINSINSTIGDSKDTLIVKSISDTNQKITNKTSNLISTINSEKSRIVDKIKARIAELEIEEKIVFQREQEELEKKNSSNDSQSEN